MKTPIKEMPPRLQGVRTALVLGMGKSGCAAARLLGELGLDVTARDAARADALTDAMKALSACDVTPVAGPGGLPDRSFDLCVVSPGFACDHSWVIAAAERCACVISELELGASLAAFPMLAVTGTNGKSSFVQLCTNAIKLAGMRAVSCGNYGTPLCEVVRCAEPVDWGVVEVSSFQMELTQCFHPRVGVLLNIQPDHLDRHVDMQRYRALKGKMFDRMGRGDTAVIPFGPEGDAVVPASCGEILRFGGDAQADLFYETGVVTSRADRRRVVVRDSWFDNPVLGRSASAALGALRPCGVSDEKIGSAFSRFEPLPHRMFTIARKEGVRFVDDSKATNISSMVAALKMTRSPVLLIAGGLLKEKRLDLAKEFLEKGTKRVYLIGEAAEEMAAAWCDVVVCRPSRTLEQAVASAIEDAQAGDTVLLSPGCASFDQFRNYHDRGERFAEFVRKYALTDFSIGEA